jgi:hypothetical protein
MFFESGVRALQKVLEAYMDEAFFPTNATLSISGNTMINSLIGYQMHIYVGLVTES